MIRNDSLIIFQNFETDMNLPKWRVKNSRVDDDATENGGFNINMDSIINIPRPAGALIDSNSLYRDECEFYDWASMSWWQRFIHSITKTLFFRKPKFKPQKSDRPALKDIKRVFEEVVDNASSINSISSENHDDASIVGIMLLELAAYGKLLEQAKENGQTALFESLQDNSIVFLYEAVLAACGFNKIITEKMLIEFLTMQPDKKPTDGQPEPKRYYSGFRLDWMKNFTRVLPVDVAAKKKIADELKIFDNYVVFHYDPEGAANAMTKAEIEAAKKDPILFGVIKNSNKLYFVADWIDEFCDLTMKEVVEKLKTDGKTDQDFELAMTNNRSKLGKIGNALIEAEFKEMDEIKRLAKAWLC
jgi:hypothetical protein